MYDYQPGMESNAETCSAVSLSSLPPKDWFEGVPWRQPPDTAACLAPAFNLPRPKLLGGSSKLAKLAEERRKKAAAASNTSNAPGVNGTLSALDRLTISQDAKENVSPSATSAPRKYPVRKQREPTPPPREPTPPPAEPEEPKPDLRAEPTAFGRTLSSSSASAHATALMPLGDILGSARLEEDPFKGPSPDDTVFKAQQHSKGLTR